MNDDDVRPWRGPVTPPSDIAGAGHAEGGSEPVYLSVLLSSGLLDPPGRCEPACTVRQRPPLPVPARAKAVRRRLLANGRQLRLLPGGRQGNSPGRCDGAARPGEPGPAFVGSPEQCSDSANQLQVPLPTSADERLLAADPQPAPGGPLSDPGGSLSDPAGLPMAPAREYARGVDHTPAEGTSPGGRDQPAVEDEPGQTGQASEYADAGAGASPGRHKHRHRHRHRHRHPHPHPHPHPHNLNCGCQRPAPKTMTLSELRAMWAAQSLSSAGDLVAQVAIAIAVFDQTRSPFLTALAYALTYLPPLLGGRLLARLTADLAPRSVMIALDLARAGLVAGMALTGPPVAGLCMLLLAVMLLGAPFSAARRALLQHSSPAVRRPGAGLSSGAISFQASQALGFLLGAAAVAALRPGRVLLIDAATFVLSAALLAALVRHRAAWYPAEPAGRQAPGQTIAVPQAASQSASVSADPAPAGGRTGPGVASMLRTSPLLRTLLLFGWLAGFYVVPEGLAVPYARALGGGPLTAGLLMAAMPTGAIVGIIAFTRTTPPAARTQLLGWLGMLCCMPLAFSALRPPLWVVLVLWTLAGAGTAYHLVVAAAFSQAVRDDGGTAALGALGAAQSGLLAAQALGFVAAGAVAELIGPQQAVALAGLLGLTAAAVLGRVWDRQYDRLVWASRAGITIMRDPPAAW